MVRVPGLFPGARMPPVAMVTGPAITPEPPKVPRR